MLFRSFLVSDLGAFTSTDFLVAKRVLIEVRYFLLRLVRQTRTEYSTKDAIMDPKADQARIRQILGFEALYLTDRGIFMGLSIPARLV